MDHSYQFYRSRNTYNISSSDDSGDPRGASNVIAEVYRLLCFLLPCLYPFHTAVFYFLCIISIHVSDTLDNIRKSDKKQLRPRYVVDNAFVHIINKYNRIIT